MISTFSLIVMAASRSSASAARRSSTRSLSSSRARRLRSCKTAKYRRIVESIRVVAATICAVDVASVQNIADAWVSPSVGFAAGAFVNAEAPVRSLNIFAGTNE
ncbi:hypothetical protein C8R46DRAFT_1058902, partial [Mycena filopes]